MSGIYNKLKDESHWPHFFGYVSIGGYQNSNTHQCFLACGQQSKTNDPSQDSLHRTHTFFFVIITGKKKKKNPNKCKSKTVTATQLFIWFKFLVPSY